MLPSLTPRHRRTLVLAGIATGVATLLLAACSASSHSTSSDSVSPDSAVPDCVVGTWGDGVGDQPQLVISEDGTLGGTDGCNRLFGTWEYRGDTVSFGEVGSTMMACPDVDTWLAGFDSAWVDGDRLHVNDAAGIEIGILIRMSA